MSNKRTLFETLAPLVPNGAVVGAKVVPTAWVNKGLTDSFYTVVDAKFTHGFRDGVVTGIRTWKGKADAAPVEINDATRLSWRLYTDPAELALIKKKLAA
ncbi:UNVERIFIED_CONTAM: hypothetical protein HDU68_006793 [Siphonaria sp. JEL0065]|nr:hypothetical protein HDU68_006793 [Siphonaria sp. JEL0065]